MAAKKLISVSLSGDDEALEAWVQKHGRKPTMKEMWEYLEYATKMVRSGEGVRDCSSMFRDFPGQFEFEFVTDDFGDQP